MKPIISSLAMAALAIGAWSPTASAQENDAAVVRSISASSGTFANPGSMWNQQWSSTATAPAVYLTSSRNDMKAADNGTGLDLREGSAKSSTYTITTDGGWRVNGFTLVFRGNSADNPVTVTSGAHSAVSTPDEDRTITVTDLGEYESALFTLTGNNQGITTSEFTVTLLPIQPEDYTEVTVNMTTGAFAAGTSVWSQLWQTAPGSDKTVYLASENGNNGTAAANMQAAGNNLDLREGSAKSSNYVISTAGSWRVSGFELTFKSNDADNPVTVSSGAATLTSSATQEQTLTVNNVPYGSKATFNLAGNNQGITATSFKVRLSPTSPDGRGVCVFPY